MLPITNDCNPGVTMAAYDEYMAAINAYEVYMAERDRSPGTPSSSFVAPPLDSGLGGSIGKADCSGQSYEHVSTYLLTLWCTENKNKNNMLTLRAA